VRLQNQPLQLTGATSEEVITVRCLEVKQHGALSRAFEVSRLQLSGGVMPTTWF
jgi:hypothetical protein